MKYKWKHEFSPKWIWKSYKEIKPVTSKSIFKNLCGKYLTESFKKIILQFLEKPEKGNFVKISQNVQFVSVWKQIE